MSGDGRFCGACGSVFIKREGNKGYNRRSCETTGSPRTLGKVFSKDVSGYLCLDCVAHVNAQTMRVRRDGAFRRTWPTENATSTPCSKSPKRKKRPSSILTPKGTPKKRNTFSTPSKRSSVLQACKYNVRSTWRQQLNSLITQSHYKQAFRLIVRNSKAAKTAMIRCVTELVRKEITTVTGRKSRRVATVETLAGEVTLPRMQDFSWKATCGELRRKTPTLFAVLDSAFPSLATLQKRAVKGTKIRRRLLSTDEADDVKCCHLGVMANIILHSAAPKLYKFVGSAMSVELWRHGTSHKIFSILNHVGITLSVKAARGHVDRLSKNHDDEMKAWKLSVESVEPVNVHQPRRRLFVDNINDDERNFSVGWDNLQMEVHTKHQTSEQHNRFLLMALCYGVRHRVPTRHLVDETRLKAFDLPASVFLPSVEDYEEFLRPRLITMVRRILATHLVCLDGLSKNADRSIPHPKSDIMRQKSLVVNLGVVDANPASTEGVISILEHLHTYVPVVRGRPFTIPCNGDQLSVERMTHAKRGRLPGATPDSMFLGLLETPQEFHKEGILLQDTMNMFFDGRSIADRGTLAQLKDYFQHRSLTTRVMENFQHAWDFIEFVTESFVVLCAMRLSRMPTIDHVPDDLPQDTEGQTKWLNGLARRIVERCWLPYDVADLRLASSVSDTLGELNNDDDTVFPFCSCRSDIGGPMVQCCNNLCPDEWFHFECTEPTLQRAPRGDWYCSDACLNSRGYIYCHCQRKRGPQEDNDLIQCHLKKNCRKRERYHRACISVDPINPDNWYCSDECALQEEMDDGVLEYTKGVMWRGLMHLANRDAIRQGDGPAMLKFWRLNMPDFWINGHPKYFILGHRLLANTHGFQDERLTAELTWERVCNPSGQPGENIPLDLLNEFLNNDFKEMLKQSRGNYTEQQMRRCSHLGGAFGKEVDRIFNEAMGMSSSVYTKKKKSDRYKRDLEKFITDFRNDALCDYVPPREHRAFPGFVYKTQVRAPRKLGRHIKHLSEELDFWRVREQRRPRLHRT